MRVPIKLCLIFDGFCCLVGRVLDWPMMVVVAVCVVCGSRAVVQVQAHAKTRIELRVMGGFHKTKIRGAPAQRILRSQQVILCESINFV